MRKLLLTLPLLALAAAQPAYAVGLATGSAISTSGSVIASPGAPSDISAATSLDFTTETGVATPGTPGLLTSYGTGLGSFAGITCNNPAGCGTIQDLLAPNFVTGAQSITDFVVLTGGSNPSAIHFDLSSINSITRTIPGFLLFTAGGTIRYDGFDPTPGIFQFSAQGTTITSFSGTVLAAVPEPATWAMMLLGFGGIGMAMRRRRRPALAQLA